MHYDRVCPTWPSRQHSRPGRGCSQEEPVGRVSRRRHPTIRGWMRRVRPSDYAPLIRPTTAFTGDPTGGTPSRWTPVLWQTPDLKINHAGLLIICMLDIPAPSHTPSPLPCLCLTQGNALTTYWAVTYSGSFPLYGSTTFVLGFAVEAGMVTESVGDGHGGAVSATFVRVDRSWRSPAVSYTVIG